MNKRIANKMWSRVHDGVYSSDQLIRARRLRTRLTMREFDRRCESVSPIKALMEMTRITKFVVLK